MIDQLKIMKDNLINCVQSQISNNLEKVEAKELSEAVDMIKDLAEAIYYCTITEAMDEKEQEEKYLSRSVSSYYSEPMPNSTMYYNGRGGASLPSSSARKTYPMIESRDMREGRSPMYRKMYMDSKMMHDKAKSMQDLDSYMQELTSDLVDMV